MIKLRAFSVELVFV